MTAGDVVRSAARIIAAHGETMTLSREGEATTIGLKGKRIPGSTDDVGGSAEQQRFRVKIGTAELLASAYFEIEFTGGSEAQYTFGAPAANLHRERGQVTIRAVTRLRAGTTVRDLAETYLAQIRSAFRMRRFAAGARTIRITAVAPMGGGFDEGGMWVESLALAYETYNVG
ncbi:MAG: hypothetical protein ACK4JB_23740 [Reyranella sp.]